MKGHKGCPYITLDKNLIFPLLKLIIAIHFEYYVTVNLSLLDIVMIICKV